MKFDLRLWDVLCILLIIPTVAMYVFSKYTTEIYFESIAGGFIGFIICDLVRLLIETLKRK
jgi:hypothetical protein